MNHWLTALKFIGIGWYISFAILGGVLGGRWLDERLNSEPFLLITGLFLGLIAAFFGAYQMVNGTNNKRRK
ncbi:conserved hypothetical protein [Dehalogenimonas lykanthroporepellens BL-DC-9]|nr:conserved hypothetical protein [Dehalogenimonas lykanthroporepellens BL-DC-9]